MKILIDNKEYLIWYEYKAEQERRRLAGGYSKIDVRMHAYCLISDADQTWIYRTQVSHWNNEFRKLIHRKDSLAKVLKYIWPGREHKEERRSAWNQIFKQMKIHDGDKKEPMKKLHSNRAEGWSESGFLK